MKKRRRMEATGHQNRRTNEDDGDHESLGKVALFYAQCAENHQPDHNGLEKKAAAQSRLAKRRYYEDENDQGDSYESKAQVARPELGHMLVKNRSWSLMHILRHEERPPSDYRRTSDLAILDEPPPNRPQDSSVQRPVRRWSAKKTVRSNRISTLVPGVTLRITAVIAFARASASEIESRTHPSLSSAKWWPTPLMELVWSRCPQGSW